MAGDRRNRLSFGAVAGLMVLAFALGLAVGWSIGIEYSATEGKIEVPAP